MILAALTVAAFGSTAPPCAFEPGDRLPLHVHTYYRTGGDTWLYD